MGKYNIIKHTKWDAADAKYHHWWTLHEWRKPRFRKEGWYPVKAWYYDSMGGSNDPVVYHSPEQAKAAAKHYGIEVQL